MPVFILCMIWIAIKDLELWYYLYWPAVIVVAIYGFGPYTTMFAFDGLMLWLYLYFLKEYRKDK